MLKIIFRISNRAKQVRKSLRRHKYHIDEQPHTYRMDTNQIVQQLYFPSLQQNPKPIEDEKVEEQQVDDPLRKLYTVSELIEFYDQTDPEDWEIEDYEHWIKRFAYCVKYEDKIIEDQKQYAKQQIAMHRQKYNKQLKIEKPIILSKTQIIQNETLLNIINSYAQLCQLKDLIQIKKLIYTSLDQPYYPIDLLILDQIISSNELRNNEDLIIIIDYLAFLKRDLAKQNYSFNQLEEIYQLLHKQKNEIIPFFNSIITNSLNNINIETIDTNSLVKLLTLMNFQNDVFINQSLSEKISAKVLITLHSMNFDDSIQVALACLKLQISNKIIYEGLLWNLIRHKEQFSISGGLLKLLLKFKNQSLYFKNQSQNPVLLDCQTIYWELFQLIQQQLTQLNYRHLTSILQIGYQNYIDNQVSIVLGAEIFKQSESLTSENLTKKIHIIYQLSQLGMSALSQQVNKLIIHKINEQSKVEGYFQKIEEASDDQDQQQFYQKYYSKEFEVLIKLLWSALAQKEIKTFETLNILITKINQLLMEQQQILILKKNTLRLISQINLFIKLKGKKMFNQSINTDILQSIQILQDSYQLPIPLNMKIMLLERVHFMLKYKENLQSNIWHDGVFFDVIYTNPKTQNSALIMFLDSNHYQIKDKYEMRPLRQVQFMDELIQLSQLPVVFIDLPNTMAYNMHQSKTTYIENQLKEILENDNQLELEEEIKELQSLRSQLGVVRILNDQIEDINDEDNNNNINNTNNESYGTYQLSDDD